MTTLASTAPALLETTTLPASTTTLPASTTLLPASTTVLTPEHVCAIGFIWVVELASCMPVKGLVQPRSGFRKCIEGYFLDFRYNNCVRKKYHGQQIDGPIRNIVFPKATTEWIVEDAPMITPKAYTGRWFSYGENLATTNGYD